MCPLNYILETMKSNMELFMVLMEYRKLILEMEKMDSM